MLTAKLRAVIEGMLAYEVDKFDAEPVGYQSGGFNQTIHDTREEAEAAARLAGFRPDTVEPVYGDLNVSGADLVDAFTEWREQLREALKPDPLQPVFGVRLRLDEPSQQPQEIAEAIHHAVEHWKRENGLTADEDPALVVEVMEVTWEAPE